jgi:septal ring factor EnvC (AmiA/AmiB activator)
MLFCDFMPGSSAVLILICMFLQQGRDMVNYIQNELEALEREQKQIDKQAALLEKDLRRVMESGTVLTGD